VWGGEEITRVNITAAAGVISESFTSTQDRYHRLRVPSYQGEIAEVFIGRDRTPVRGPEPDWIDQPIPNVIETRLRSGNTYRIQASEERRQFAFEYNRISGADLTIFTELDSQTASGLYPLWFFPPDDSESPLFVELERPLKKKQDSTAPRSLGQRFAFTVEMIQRLQ
jgi:hypothetical protein